jgi:hypothetical protein
VLSQPSVLDLRHLPANFPDDLMVPLVCFLQVQALGRQERAQFFGPRFLVLLTLEVTVHHRLRLFLISRHSDQFVDLLTNNRQVERAGYCLCYSRQATDWEDSGSTQRVHKVLYGTMNWKRQLFHRSVAMAPDNPVCGAQPRNEGEEREAKTQALFSPPAACSKATRISSRISSQPSHPYSAPSTCFMWMYHG